MEAGFTAAVAKLDLEPNLSKLALSIFESCQPAISESCTGGHSSQEEDSKRLWYASILFIAKSLWRDAAGGPGDSPGITLTQILESFEISLADFLKELPVVCKKAEPEMSKLQTASVPLERHLKLRELQTSFVYTTVVAKKCRDLFQIYFKLPTAGRYNEPSVFHLVWQLFIVAKAKLFPPFPDLVSSFNLLICVLAFAFCHVPAAQRAVVLTDSEKLPTRTEDGSVDVLESLGAVNQANSKELKPLMARLDTVLRSMLADFGKDKMEEEENVKQPEMDKLVLASKLFPGLLSSEESLAQAQSELNRTYEQMYSSISEIDERPFVEARPPKDAGDVARGAATPPSMTKCQVGTPVRSRSLGVGVPGTPVRLLPSPLRPANQHMLQTPSPVRVGASSFFATPGLYPGTPVSEAMAAASWLQDLTARSSSELAPELQQFFETAGPGVGAAVAERVARMADAVFPPQPDQDSAPLGVLNGALVSPRGAEGVKLYFRVLEGMLKAEQDRTGRSNFASLLASSSFHKCLAACAFEVVIASYRMVTHAFPAVLERLQLPAFDMSKLVGTFVRHISPAEQVPRELKRHLFSIEEKILEQQAWEGGSSLYPLLASACGAPPAAANSGPRRPEPDTVMDESPPVSSRKGGSASSTPTKRRADAAPDLSTPTKAAKPAEGSTAPARAAAAEEAASAAAEEPCSPTRPDVPAEVAEAAAALVSAASGGLQSPRGSLNRGLLSPRRKSDSSAFSSFMSPLRRPAAEQLAVPGALPAAFGRPGEGLERPGRAVVSDFLNKVLKLAALRITDICDRLDFEPLNRDQIVLQVYTMVSHVVSEHTNLLYGRHLDQVILCALYGVCKVNQLKQITFKDIITHYKKQAQAKNSIFRTVSIQLNPDLQVVKTGDVIEFYNAVFIPATKAFLLQLGNKTAALAQLPTLSVPGTPLRLGTPLGPRSFSTPPALDRLGAPASAGGAVPGGVPSFAAVSPAHATPGGKVFVSPMHQSPQQVFMGQRAHSMFSARMGESTAAYQSPSKDLSFINSRLQGRHPFRATAAGPDAAAAGHAVVLQTLDPNSAMAHAPLVQHALGLVHANGGVPSSERSTGSHASDHPSASLGSHMSSEPSGSPPAGRAARAGRAADSGLLDLAAAAEQGRLPNGVSTDSEESGGTARGRPIAAAVAVSRGASQDS